MSGSQNPVEYILGLDIGAESIGWAVIPTDRKIRSTRSLAGVHTFDTGVEGDMESGRDQSRAKARRDARSPRRQIWRRNWRRCKLLRLLQRYGLMPHGQIATPEERHALITKLDRQLREKHLNNGNPAQEHLLPYLLRAKALQEKLEPHELGRALYHLAQRRGFKSNRKAGRKDEEGVVKSAIGKLAKKMADADSPTLGAYFAGRDPESDPIRGQYTSRQMYQEEFDAIWTSQADRHKFLDDELRKRIRDTIFDQRPLKSQKHLIGTCDLVDGATRAPWALRIAQRFRLLQKVNDLVIVFPDGMRRSLDARERQRLIGELMKKGDITFTTVRSKKLLGFPRGSEFTHEEGGEKKLTGHRTDAQLRKVFGDRWDQLSERERNEVVDDIRSFENAEPLIKRGQTKWGLDPEAAHELATIELEVGFAAHSRQALQTLVGLMEDGTSYTTARMEGFPQARTTEPLDKLPPVLDAVPSLRNPAVTRTLTELRKLINALIREYGKPRKIRIELARNLKQPRKRRQQISEKNRDNERRRQKAKKKIWDELKIEHPKRRDIEKVILADECNWTCPYTGDSICMRTLFGANPQFDVEHILPFSKSLDNTYVNKTLCAIAENRRRKRNLTPYQAYTIDAERWDEILQRVKRFRGEGAREKLRRFCMEEIPEDFTLRQLQDTRYASRLAGEYLALLYGGRSDASGTQRIQAGKGGITHHLRNVWDLNAVLGPGNRKTRDDHRQHAIDAIIIALSDAKIVKKLSLAAENAPPGTRDLFVSFPAPWPDFVESVRTLVDNIHVSRRVSRKIAGPLHADSMYSKPIRQGSDREVRHIRKELFKLTHTEIVRDKIVDPTIRKLVRDKYQQLGGKGGKDPSKIFSDPANHPFLTTRDGRKVSIHKARIVAGVSVREIAEGARKRYVTSKPGSNHHTVIVAYLGKRGEEIRWVDEPVSRLEVYKNLARKRSVDRRFEDPSECFKFSLVPNDYVLMEDDHGHEQLYRVASLSKGDIEFRAHWDARTIDELKKAKARVRASGEKLRKGHARKVTVTYLGEIRTAND